MTRLLALMCHCDVLLYLRTGCILGCECFLEVFKGITLDDSRPGTVSWKYLFIGFGGASFMGLRHS